MILLAAANGVTAVRDPRNHGVWVNGRKLGSVGIAIRHGIAFHGLALNVNISLEPFSWVNPCGLLGVQMTTLSHERDREVTIEEVKTGLAEKLCQVFARELVSAKKDYLDARMHRQEKIGKTPVAEA